MVTLSLAGHDRRVGHRCWRRKCCSCGARRIVFIMVLDEVVVEVTSSMACLAAAASAMARLAALAMANTVVVAAGALLPFEVLIINLLLAAVAATATEATGEHGKIFGVTFFNISNYEHNKNANYLH